MSSKQLIFTDDPYQKFLQQQTNSKNLIANDRSSKFSRKFRTFLNELNIKKTYFIYGGMQGFAIGCLAGLGIGIISVFQTRSFITIPISMVLSGCFFACVMAFGSIVRSDGGEYMLGYMPEERCFTTNNQYQMALYIQKCGEMLRNQKYQSKAQKLV